MHLQTYHTGGISTIIEGDKATKGWEGAGEWEPFKNSHREQSSCPGYNPTRFSSNRQAN